MTETLEIDWDDTVQVSHKFALRGQQPEWLASIIRDFETKSRVLVVAPGGVGKCLGRDTPVLMFDGSVKMSQDIRVGDLLVGPDSAPRMVKTTCQGTEMLYRVTQAKGDSYVVNESHILSLKVSSGRCGLKHKGVDYAHGDVLNVSVKDYLSERNAFRHSTMGWRSGVSSWHAKPHLDMPPYILGVWLGDGSTGAPRIATMDHEIVSAISDWAATVDLIVSNVQMRDGKCPALHLKCDKNRGWFKNRMVSALTELGIYEAKAIPYNYRMGSIEDRLQLLAGLIDTDGSLCRGNCYDFISMHRHLADDVTFIARSLGLWAQVRPCQKRCQNGNGGTYYRVCISGDIDRIPCRIARKKAAARRIAKNVLHVGIRVAPIGVGDYYGFELAGPDGLFLLGDFTVTHNTTLFAALAAHFHALGIRTLVLENRDRLTRQTADRIRVETGIDVEIEMGDEHASPFAPIVVASVQTLGRVNRLTGFSDTHFGLIVADECLPCTAEIDGKKISEIRVGDYVTSYNHSSGKTEKKRVVRLFKNPAKRLIKIYSNDRMLCATEAHPIFSISGYRSAGSLKVGDFIADQEIPMQGLRNGSNQSGALLPETNTALQAMPDKQIQEGENRAESTVQELRHNGELHRIETGLHKSLCDCPESGVLFNTMSREVDKRKLKKNMWTKDSCVQSKNGISKNESKQSNSYAGCEGEDRCKNTGKNIFRSWRKRPEHKTTNCSWLTASAHEAGARDRNLICCEKFRVPSDELQSRSCRLGNETSRRSGWKIPQDKKMDILGQKENRGIKFSRVDRIEILERGSGLRYSEVCPDDYVYNFEVEGNNNYFANGFLVHNCHFSLAPQWQRVLCYFHYGAHSLAPDWKRPEDGTYEVKARCAGFTATPDIGERRNLGQFFHHRSVNYSYLEAVQDGWLVGPVQKNIPVRIDLSKYKAKSTPNGNDFAASDLSAALIPIIEELAEQILIHASAKKTIAFLPSVECARMMTDALLRRGTRAIFVSGECLDASEKTDEFAALGAGSVLVNCCLYVYGVDFPDVDCIAWFRATISKAFYIQGIYRGTRVLPGILNGLKTAEERRDAIACSKKPSLLILDPLFVSDRIDLLDAYDLLTDEPEVKKAMKASGELSVESAQKAERDFLKSLKKEAKKHERKTARTIDPLSWACSLGDSLIRSYVPTEAWESQPASVGQLDFIRHQGMEIGGITSKGLASRIISRLRVRQDNKLASPKQLRLMHQLGLDEQTCATLTQAEATVTIDRMLQSKRERGALVPTVA